VIREPTRFRQRASRGDARRIGPALSQVCRGTFSSLCLGASVAEILFVTFVISVTS
jgi:hypothetical protein